MTTVYPWDSDYPETVERSYKLVNCGSCGAIIERSTSLGNRVFTCYDCKKKWKAAYDKQRKALCRGLT